MKQNSTTLENREVTIRKPRDLAKRLMCEMLGAALAKGHAFDTIGQASFFESPADPYVTHIASRHFGNPVKRGEDEVRHSVASI